jgi:hypothetical protein
MTGLVIGIVMAGVFLVIASMRGGSSSLGDRPKRLKSFTASMDSQKAFKSVIRFAQQTGYKISAIDEDKKQLVLEESASATSWGFLYPIFVSTASEGAALIEVGIKSKLAQVGPIVTRSHEKCFNGIQAAILAEKND